MNSFLRRIGRRLFDAPYLLLSLTMLFWAGNAVVGRYVAGHVPPVALGTLRWIVAAALIAGFAWPHLRADWPTIRTHMPFLLLLSVAGISVFNTLTYYALQFTESINATLLQSVGPILVAAFSFLLWRERLRPLQIVGLLVAFVGVAIIIARGDVAALLALHFNPGDLFLIAAMASYALYSALLRRRPAIHPLSFVTVTMGIGGIVLLPVLGAEIATGYTLSFDLLTMFAIAYVVLFPSLLAHFFFYRGVELVGANRAAPLMYLVPIFGAVLAMIFLGERVRLYHVIAFALVFAGIMFATRAPRAKATAA
jgi:drug/metabolite transporter (DMT)-like permease